MYIQRFIAKKWMRVIKMSKEQTSEIRVDELVIFIRGNNVYIDKSDKYNIYINGQSGNDYLKKDEENKRKNAGSHFLSGLRGIFARMREVVD